jgi:hypothetical protein
LNNIRNAIKISGWIKEKEVIVYYRGSTNGTEILFPSDGNIIRYVHKKDQSVVTFRLTSDGYYHARMSSTVGPLMVVAITKKVLESKVCLKTVVTDKPEDEEGFGAQSKLAAIEGGGTPSRHGDGETLHLELNGVDARHDEITMIGSNNEERSTQQHQQSAALLQNQKRT